ncbi:MAG: CRTAC1 family protein, partial [Pirellulales bacterium]|nr:CRTAC1 family protein [Pirellulales bacterium]
QTDQQPGRYQLLESAGILDCSIGANGVSQACMGVTAGDFDRNGWLDLHVTNFYNESSNLYLQSETGFFIDDALKYGLKSMTHKILGFGTHAADIDNDGWQDLAILNGHVHDDSANGIPFEMESQLLRGGPRGFSLQPAEQLGAYWTGKRLGRTLAVLDWNRDGKLDLLAGHLDAPIALLENRSSAGNWIQLELVGVQSEREAIGAEVVVKAGNQVWRGWQTGGDGYMCSNEPIIPIGLGSVQGPVEVEIHWPAGTVQTVPELDINHRYLIVEGEPPLVQK